MHYRATLRQPALRIAPNRGMCAQIHTRSVWCDTRAAAARGTSREVKMGTTCACMHALLVLPVLCPLAFIVEVCTWMPRVIAFSTQAHTALWRHQHRSHRTVVVRSPRTAAHSVLQTRVCINCVSTRAHPCSGSVVLTTNGADSACVRSAAACGRGSSSDWPLTGLRPRPTRSRRTRRPPPGTQHARPSSHRARRQLDVRPRPCAGPARPARGPCKEARTTQRTRFLCRGACCVVASSGRAA